MSHMKLLLLLISSISFANGGKLPWPAPQDEQYVVRDLTAKKQEQKQWCAASAGQMLLSQFRIAPEQCEIASKFHKRNCCAQRYGYCLEPMHVEGISRLYGKTPMVDHRPSIEKVFNLIKAGTPVSIYHHQKLPGDRDNPGTDSPHTVVAYWAFVKNGKKHIIVYDPFTGTKKVWDKSYEKGNLAFYRLVWMK